MHKNMPFDETASSHSMAHDHRKLLRALSGCLENNHDKGQRHKKPDTQDKSITKLKPNTG